MPAGGADDTITSTDIAAVEVNVTDESAVPGEESPMKKPSLGRSHRIGGRPTGLQRHIKRESLQQGESPTSEVDNAGKRGSSEGGRFAITLKDGPTTK